MRALRRLYIVQCVSFTRKELRKAAAQAGRDDDDTEIGNLIFSKVFRRDGGEDVEVELGRFAGGRFQ